MPQVGLRIQTRFALPLVSVFFRWNTEDNMEKDQQVLKHPMQPNFSYFVPLVSPFPFSPQYWGIAPTIAARERRAMFSPTATSPSCCFQTYTVHLNHQAHLFLTTEPTTRD